MQVVLVTGAAQGIGRAVAERFLRDGLHLVAVDRNASRPVHLTSDEELDRFISVNLRSVFRFTREALGILQSGAAIVHVASTFGLLGNPGSSSYATTKAALVGLTRQMAGDYGPRGIRVNAVARSASTAACCPVRSISASTPAARRRAACWTR